LTYPSARLEENVRELAASLDNPVVLPCDVSSDDQIAELGRSLDREFGGLDVLVHGAAFAKPDDLAAPFSQTSREGIPHRARRERLLVHRARARDAPADAESEEAAAC
jgi:enoyl-[acyl-carrier protein] reductase I